MKSNYKRLGNYIREVNTRNVELKDVELLGVSIQKEFIPSIANTIGTNMSTYKLVKKGQFAYGPVTSRNGNKISIALLEHYEEAMISQAYTSFEVVNENILLPEYLMMWFRRPEFDRYARFISHGSVREIFSWEDMCDVELPIPPIQEQRRIVSEYNVLVNRVNLNNHLIQKLEETAKGIYKQWFVNFEFPDENGNAYKSNGGQMEFNNEFEIEIPKNWMVGKLKDLITFNNGKVKPISKGDFPLYGGNGIIEYVTDFNQEDVVIIGRVGAYCGSLFRESGKCWISDNAISAKSKGNYNNFIYFLLNSLNLNERSEGTGQPLITQGLLNEIEVVFPDNRVISLFEECVTKMLHLSELLSKEIKILNKLMNILLSKLPTMEG